MLIAVIATLVGGAGLAIATGTAGRILMWVSASFRGRSDLRRRRGHSDAVPDTSAFVGREQLLKDLGRRVRRREQRVIGIVALPRVGKSLVAAKLLQMSTRRSARAWFRRPFGRAFWLRCDGGVTFDAAMYRLVRFFHPELPDEEFVSGDTNSRIAALLVGLQRRPGLGSVLIWVRGPLVGLPLLPQFD